MKEWRHYVSTQGVLLDRGYSFEDPRYRALRAKLDFVDALPDRNALLSTSSP